MVRKSQRSDITNCALANPNGFIFQMVRRKIRNGESLQKLKMIISVAMASPPQDIISAFNQNKESDFYMLSMYLADCAFAAQAIIAEELDGVNEATSEVDDV